MDPMDNQGYLDVDEADPWYRWSGRTDGPILVLSHSLGTDSGLWEWQEETLGRKFRLLLYDHRGHGRSGAPPGEWTIDDFGRDTLALIDRVAGEPVHFCGVSLGGMVGLWLASHAPERLDRLVVADTSAFTEDPSLLRARLARLKDAGLDSIADDVLSRWFTAAFREAHPERVERFRTKLLATSLESYRATSEAVCGLDLRDRLPSIRTPTLVITGRHDEATPPAWGEAIASAVPGAGLVTLDAAHLSNVEAAAAFDRAVRAFLLDQESA